MSNIIADTSPFALLALPVNMLPRARVCMQHALHTFQNVCNKMYYKPYFELSSRLNRNNPHSSFARMDLAMYYKTLLTFLTLGSRLKESACAIFQFT
jgi:hypothetical protein